MSSCATFCDKPISTRFDGSAASSCVSLDWVLDSGIPTRGSCLSGLLKLPSNAGVISIFLPYVPVAASLPCDLVLGLDWVQLVRKLAQDVVVHLNSGSLDFRTLDSAVAQSSSTASPTPVPVPVFQANIGVRFSAFSVSTCGPGTAPPSSPMPSTGGINGVTPEVPPHMREARTSRTRGGISNLAINECDPFVRLSLQDKAAVVHFLIVDHQIDVLALRKLTARHSHLSSRLYGEKRKSANGLRSEFLAHQCTEACLVLKSEALLAGSCPPLLKPVEIQHCMLILGTRKRNSSFPSAARKDI
ncbi:hypothetical protein DFH06DRAFT_1311379 [Mycena polygramma]|nr:hypothetical protein DFH06DRAFT_1311379 [Mycena polygramma]